MSLFDWLHSCVSQRGKGMALYKRGMAKAKRKEGYPILNKPLTARLEHRANHHGLFRSEALRSIGGYFAGFRIGYDTLIINLLSMVGRISYVDRPLYHRLIRSGSLTNSRTVGLGTRARSQVTRQLAAIYGEAFELYTGYLSGYIKNEALAHSIRQVCQRRIAQRDLAELKRESERLRAILSSVSRSTTSRLQTVSTPVHAGSNQGTGAEGVQSREPSVTQLVNDPRIVWNEWTISKSAAIELAARLDDLHPKRILELGVEVIQARGETSTPRGY